ncbi:MULTISPECIES: hypothetical protein [unclassified Acidovorax]|uniref:hypothetical protein n=1 Tax=unclassified Acidovorax TaxID=2684926 RepID=UPI0028830708|nr:MULTISPECIES: hypothetical protein [unclassified Acidovorax]
MSRTSRCPQHSLCTRLGTISEQQGTYPQWQAVCESCCLFAPRLTRVPATGLAGTQAAVGIEEKALVHKKAVALLLLLFIYKDFRRTTKQPSRAGFPGRLPSRQFIRGGSLCRHGQNNWLTAFLGDCYSFYSYKRWYSLR